MRSPTTWRRCRCPRFAKWTTHPIQPLSISHQGQFPAITISFNLAQGTALGQATEAIEKAKAELNVPATINTALPGQCAGIPGLALDRAAPDRRGIDRRLPHSRHSLRELHPSDHDPLDSPLGRCRCAGDPDAVSLRFQSCRAHRHHSADRHREEERNHDGRFRHRGNARRRPVGTGGHPPCLPYFASARS